MAKSPEKDLKACCLKINQSVPEIKIGIKTEGTNKSINTFKKLAHSIKTNASVSIIYFILFASILISI